MGEDIKEIKDKLMDSPLFQLSLANKELFHSNFLAWFGNKYQHEFKELINQFLGSEICPDNFSIDREFEHFDICIKDSGKNPIIIIENKVKSVPTKEQLDGYRSMINRETCRFILLTMTPNLHDMTKAEGWDLVTYKDLSDGLAKVVLSDTYHKELLNDYCDYVANLQRIIEHFDKMNSYCSTDNEDELMKELRIHDICGKRKVQSVYNSLVEKLKEKLPKEVEVVSKESDLTNDNLMVGLGFTNSQPLVEVKLKSGEDIIVIQIQGKQYRHAVEFFDATIGERIEFDKNKKYPFKPNTEGLRYLANRYSFILSLDPDSNILNPNLKPQNYPFPSKKFGQNKQPGYCRYCNGKIGKNNKISCFVYQWIKIPEDTTIDELVYYIVSDTKQVIEDREKANKEQL